MALGRTEPSTSCSVSQASLLEKPEERDPSANTEEACSREPNEERMRDFLTFLAQTASSSLNFEGAATNTPQQSGNAMSNAKLLSRISALEIELEDKEHSLKALREFREREKLQDEHTRKHLLLQLREEMAKNTVSRRKSRKKYFLVVAPFR